MVGGIVATDLTENDVDGKKRNFRKMQKNYEKKAKVSVKPTDNTFKRI